MEKKHIIRALEKTPVDIGDMWQQTRNDYGDGYSNVIIHPDGRVGVNWN